MCIYVYIHIHIHIHMHIHIHIHIHIHTYTHTYIYRDTYVQYISVATNTTEPTNHGYTGQFILNLKL